MKIPEKYHGLLESKDVAFMGLSLGKPQFNNKKIMEEYINFLTNNFNKSFLIIGDLPKRHNILALENVREEEALQRISKTSKNMRRFLEKLSSKYSNIQIIDWTDSSDLDYCHNLSILKREYNNNLEFQEECNNIVRKFISIPSNKDKLEVIGSNIKQGVKISSNYLLEELSMLLSLPLKLGVNVCEIYPGKNEVQEKLQNDEYNFCSELKKNPKRTFMEVYHE
jgi:tRNA-dependent cyclodipeptide synthase